MTCQRVSLELYWLQARWLKLCLPVIFMLGTVPAHAEKSPDEVLQAALRITSLANALNEVGRSEARAASLLTEIASIASPSGREHDRAAKVADLMRNAGLVDVEVDNTPNVAGRIVGMTGKALVFVTMLDDLPITEEFQREGLRPRREGDRVVGPATDIQSAVAAMVLAAEALVASGVHPRHDLVFAAVAREETGLQGMEALYSRYKDNAVGFVEVLGDGQAVHYGAGGAIGWWKVVAHGPEGHTGTGGLPNVNQAIANAASEIFNLQQPERHKSTFINIGIIRSGETFNHKPATGWFSLDIRSQERRVVEEIVREVRRILVRVSQETHTRLEMVPDFQSLGGQIPGARDSYLTRSAIAVSRHLGFQPELSDAGCCNMRVPIGEGTPAVGIRGERGGARATRDEWASIPAMLNMARHMVLMGVTAGELQ